MYPDGRKVPPGQRFMLTPSAAPQSAVPRVLSPMNRPPQPGNVFNIQLRRRSSTGPLS